VPNRPFAVLAAERLWGEEAQDLVEYGLLLVLLALAAIASMGKLATAVLVAFKSAALSLTTS